MERSKRALFLLLVCAAILLCNSATGDAAISLGTDASATLDSVLDEFEAKGGQIGGNIIGAATSLFWILATIQFCWAAVGLGVRGELSLGAVWSMLFRELMVIGIFYFLLQNWNELNDWIVGSLANDLVGKAYPEAAGGKVSDMLRRGVEIAHTIVYQAKEQIGWFGDGLGLFLLACICALVILVVFAMAAGAAAVYMIEWYVLVPCGVILLGLGGSSWTKSYAEAYLRSLFALGMKIFALKVVMCIIGEVFLSAADVIEGGAAGDEFTNLLIALTGISIIAYMLQQQIPNMATSLVSGGTIASGSATLAAAASGMAGNAQQAAGAIQAGGSAASGALESTKKAASQASAAYKAASSSGGSSGGGGGSSDGGKSSSLGSALRAVGAGAFAGAKSLAGDATGAVAGALGFSQSKSPDPVASGLQNANKTLQNMDDHLAGISKAMGIPDEKNELSDGRTDTTAKLTKGGEAMSQVANSSAATDKPVAGSGSTSTATAAQTLGQVAGAASSARDTAIAQAGNAQADNAQAGTSHSSMMGGPGGDENTSLVVNNETVMQQPVTEDDNTSTQKMAQTLAQVAGAADSARDSEDSANASGRNDNARSAS